MDGLKMVKQIHRYSGRIDGWRIDEDNGWRDERVDKLTGG